MLSKAVAISALAASASAHIIMSYPKPFATATLNQSPLAPADFPCKQRAGGYAIDTMNQWNAGETQKVSFMGTAVHGGGSCQFSITTDPEPTKDSQWKVIQSVIGGCPTNLTDENFSDKVEDPVHKPVPDTFPVTMPSNIPEGRYTFAWTWLNKVGNREFYMNCAPIQVGSNSASVASESAAKALAALPDMFVANLPREECTTEDSTNFVYPNPGSAVSQLKDKSLSKTVSGSGCAAQNKLGAGKGQIGSPAPGNPSTPSGSVPSKPSGSVAPSSKPSSSATPAPKPSKSAAASPNPNDGAYPTASPIDKGPTPSKAPINPGGVFAPGASSAPSEPATPAPQPEEPAPAVPSAAPQAPNNTTPSNGECTPCTTDGAVVCIGSKQFGLCNRGCAVAQDLAAGMSCSQGAVVASTKRHIHFPRAHLHRRLSAARLI